MGQDIKELDQESGTDPPERKKWRDYIKMITVEPTMFFYMMAFMITSVVEQQFFIDKVCLVDKSYPEEICKNLSAHENENVEVHTRVSTFHQYNDIASQIIPIVLALFIGAWSDRRGRKLLLLLGLTGKLWYSVWVIINSMQSTWGVDIIIWSASLPSGITGADLSIFAACFSYISDTSTVKDRTVRVTILDGTYLLSMPIGIAIGKAIYNSITDQVYPKMFGINAALLFVALVYSFIRLDWATTPQQQPLKLCCLNTHNHLVTADGEDDEKTQSDACCVIDFFDIHHLISTVKTLCKKRLHHGRTFLIVLIISLALYTFQRDERQMSYLYTHLKFKWEVNTFSDYRTYQTSIYVLGTFICVPFMGRILKFSDTTMIMIGTTSHALARVVYVVAKVPWLFYLGATISSFGPVVAPVLRSMSSKIVPLEERGKVFAMMSVADSTVPLFSGIIYTQVYNATLTTYPSAIYWVTVTTQMIVFIAALGIKLTLRKTPIEACAGTESS